jgi:hypothetical protein
MGGIDHPKLEVCGIGFYHMLVISPLTIILDVHSCYYVGFATWVCRSCIFLWLCLTGSNESRRRSCHKRISGWESPPNLGVAHDLLDLQYREFFGNEIGGDNDAGYAVWLKCIEMSLARKFVFEDMCGI